MTLLHRALNVLRIMVEAANDDNVLKSAGDIELAFVEKSRIAGTQKWTLFCFPEACLKSQLGFIGAVPVSGCHVRARYPDFTHFIGCAGREGFRINNNYSCVGSDPTGADQYASILLVLRRFPDEMLLQRGAFDSEVTGLVILTAAC